MVKAPATVWTVAAAVGVSAQTVSRVLNESGPVSPATRDKVLAEVARQGYRPSNVGRGLRSRRMSMIGLLVADIGNPFYARLHRALEHALQPRGYTVMLANCDDDAAIERQRLDTLAGYRPTGLVCVPAVDSTLGADDITAFRHVVTVSRTIPGFAVPSVITDEAVVVRKATDELLDAGHQHIAAVLGPQGASTTASREQGFWNAVRAHTGASGQVRYTDGTRIAAGTALDELLDEDPGITGVIGFNAPVTEGLLATMLRRGLRCPDDMSIVGFTDVGWLALHDPPITVIAQPIEEMGAKAAELVLNAVTGESTDDRQHVIPSSLIQRGSVAPPRPWKDRS